MVALSSNAGEIDLLQKLIHSSRLIQQATSYASGATSHIDALPSQVSLAALPFPPIPDLLHHLEGFGLSDRDASKVMQVFQASCVQLQSLHRAALTKMLANSSPEHRDALETCVSRLYAQKLAVLQQDVLEYAKIQCERLRQAFKPKKASFNHDYVPVLEKYFEYNAYPSAADRALMARKSMMTERQIEVWFQNHRNRSRKDGKTLARLRSSDPLPKDVSFDSLDDTMHDLLRPESERLMMEQQESEDEESDGIEALALSLDAASSSRAGSVEGDIETSAPTEQSTQQLASCPLNPLTPPFAYPAPYVPPFRSFLDATIQPTSFTFTKPSWARHSSYTGRTSVSITRRDIDNFAELFARLNVRESPKKQGRRKMAPLPQSRSSPDPLPRYTSPAATCAITTILCPGRHPAFIPSVAPRATRRARKSPSPPPPPPYQSWMSSPGAGPSKPSTSSTSATAFTFQSPPSYLQSAAATANASPEATPTPRRRRKSPQLPRRVPGSSPVTHSYSQSQNQTTSHPTPQRSPRPSHHPYASPSRASSSASSHRVSSSSSSSASSSTPTTPNGSTTSLPMSYPVNTPKNTKPTSPIFTAQNIADVFGDAAAFTTPSSQGFSGFGTAGFDSPDFGRMQMGNMFDFSFNGSHGPSIVQARS